MRKRPSFITVGTIMALALMGTGAPTSALATGISHAGIASTKCSHSEARTLVVQHRLGNGGDPTVPDPVDQVLCGAFVGPGSHAMVASLTAPSCIGIIGWVVFRLRGGTWHIVTQHDTSFTRLAASGSDIEETQSVSRPTDTLCSHTGGTRSRIWRWNGKRFVASAWTKHLAPTPAPPPAPSNPTEFYARPPGGFITCIVLGLPPEVVCFGGPQSSDPLENVATLHPDGQVETCSRHQAEVRCSEGNVGENTPTLSAREVDSIGPFMCKVLETGVECTVTATGKGFLITPESVTEVGG